MGTNYDPLICSVLVFSGFTCYFLSLGFSSSFGVYYVIFLEEFGASRAETAWFSSVNQGIRFLFCPVGSLIIAKIGCMKSLLIGGIVCSSAVLISSFSTSLLMVTITLGAFTGLGHSLVLQSMILRIYTVFDRWRMFSLGVATCGIGFGIISFPWITSALVEHYGWRGSLLVAAALQFHLIPCALVSELRPSNYKTEDISKAQKDKLQTNVDHLDVLRRLRTVTFMPLLFVGALFFFGLSIVLTHIVAYAQSLRFSASVGDLLISLLGISGNAGRIIFPIIAQIKGVEVPYLLAVGYLIAGFSLILSKFWTSFPGIITCFTIFGVSHVTMNSATTETVFTAVDVELFNVANGLYMCAAGIGFILGAPVAGWLYESTNNYGWSFVLGGVCIIVSSLLTFIAATLMHRRDKKLKIFLQQNVNC